ncbi:SPP1 family predicted phage head-tail adaptor [Paenibacillus sp. DS2015]|uniref:phage head closure protein n=1 Tax=Paenibacillus sp. DS2015 TaxID=3373917 RepID=UPI003D248FB7
MQPFKYKPKLNAGKLNRRITVQKKVPGPKDEGGYPTEDVWVDVVTLYASREPLRGREFFAAAAAQAENTVRYKIRYGPAIAADMRFIDLKDNRIYYLKGAPLDDVWGDRTETHLMATEELANG